MNSYKYLLLCLLSKYLYASNTPSANAHAGFDIHAFMPILIIFAVFYFLLIRPQNKREQERREMLKSIVKGEEVITSGGIFAKVNRVLSETDVEVELAPGVLIKMLKSNIVDLPNRRPKETANKTQKTIAEIKKEVKNRGKTEPVNVKEETDKTEDKKSVASKKN